MGVALLICAARLSAWKGNPARPPPTKERKYNPMASEKNTLRAESAAPTMQPDRKVTQKSALLLALAQPGKPLHNFLLSPTQEAAQIGSAEIAFAMVSKGKTARDVATVFGMLGTGNASALRQYFSENFTGCGGTGEAKSAPPANLADLGL